MNEIKVKCMVKLNTKTEKPWHNVMRQGTSKDTIQLASVGHPLLRMQPVPKRSLFPPFPSVVLDSSHDRNMGKYVGLGF